MSRIGPIGAVFTAALVLSCQPDPPSISDKPLDPPDPVDTDEGIPLRQPDIEVEPATLGFGSRPPNCPSETKTVTIRNVGNNPLRIDEISLAGTHAPVFEIVGNTPDTVRAGQEATFEVRFTPLQYVPYEQARIHIVSNDPDEGEVDVPLKGEGSTATTTEDTFLQQNATEVDVLFVLDNSGSMGDTIGRIRGAMNTFISSFVNLGLDYRIAITTTHLAEGEDSDGMPLSIAGSEGWFVGDWMDSGSGASAVQTAFNAQANTVINEVGSSATGDNEQGLGAANAALSAPNINQSPNSGFLRSTANLAVAVVSDENDYSGISANAFSTWLAGLKGGDMSQVSFSGLVGPSSGGVVACGSLVQGAGAAPKYHSVINQTGGVWGDICQFDVQPFLRFLSYVAAGLEISFPLDDTPVAATSQAITVQVCDSQGQCDTVPQSAIDGWTYDAGTNSIEMNGAWIPDPGETVVVNYAVASTCS